MLRLGVGVHPATSCPPTVTATRPAAVEPVRLRPLGFDDLYRDEHPTMVRIAALITGSTSTAEEIVNDAFLAVLERWTQLLSPGGYLRTSVVRAAVRSKSRRRREDDWSGRQALSATTGEPSIDEMWDAVGRLPPRQRAALVLRFYDDCSHDQIAGALHCPVATARSLVHRGLTTLRKEIDR